MLVGPEKGGFFAGLESVGPESAGFFCGFGAGNTKPAEFGKGHGKKFKTRFAQTIEFFSIKPNPAG